jgi:hypothetical protein
MVLRFQRVPPMGAHPLPSPEDLGVTEGPRRPTEARQPHQHRRFSRRGALRPATERWPSLGRRWARLPPRPWLPTQAQGALGWRRGADPPRAFSARPPGGGTRWRLQGTTCRAVVTGLPPCVLRSHARPLEVARKAGVATHGGRRGEWGAVLSPLSPLALSRVVWAFGGPRRVTRLTWGGLPRPAEGRAAAPHWRGRPATVSLPTLVWGRVRWPGGSPEAASADACPRS